MRTKFFVYIVAYWVDETYKSYIDSSVMMSQKQITKAGFEQLCKKHFDLVYKNNDHYVTAELIAQSICEHEEGFFMPNQVSVDIGL